MKEKRGSEGRIESRSSEARAAPLSSGAATKDENQDGEKAATLPSGDKFLDIIITKMQVAKGRVKAYGELAGYLVVGVLYIGILILQTKPTMVNSVYTTIQGELFSAQLIDDDGNPLTETSSTDAIYVSRE